VFLPYTGGTTVDARGINWGMDAPTIAYYSAIAWVQSELAVTVLTN